MMIDTKNLWEKYKRSPWDCGEGMIWPEDFVTGAWEEDPDVDEEYLEAATVHLETIQYWMMMLAPYKGREENLVSEHPDWAVTFEDGELVDGFHRLTAAILVELQHLHVIDTNTFSVPNPLTGEYQ